MAMKAHPAAVLSCAVVGMNNKARWFLWDYRLRLMGPGTVARLIAVSLVPPLGAEVIATTVPSQPAWEGKSLRCQNGEDLVTYIKPRSDARQA